MLTKQKIADITIKTFWTPSTIDLKYFHFPSNILISFKNQFIEKNIAYLCGVVGLYGFSKIVLISK